MLMLPDAYLSTMVWGPVSRFRGDECIRTGNSDGQELGRKFGLHW